MYSQYFSLIIIVTVSLIYILNKSASLAIAIQNSHSDYDWILRGFLNILGYLTVLLPGYFVYKYVRKINYLDKGGMYS